MRLGVIETADDHGHFAITLTKGKSYTFDIESSNVASAALINGEFSLSEIPAFG